jgi:phosphoribosylamine--glycine ligase
VLYGQFMITADGPKVIEFNSRFGDPEAMNVLALLRTPLPEVFRSMAEGKLLKPEFANQCTVVKYLVPEGYPGKSRADAEVKVDEAALAETGASAYYASVYEKEGNVYTTGSRTFGILGMGGTLAEAEGIAEKGCKCVSGPVWHRHDIGTPWLVQKRVEHMKELRK